MSGRNRLQRAVYSAVLVSACLFYVGTLALQVVGEWLRTHPSTENLSRGTRLIPANGALWAEYARHLLILSQGLQSPEAVTAYRRAAVLNPFDLYNWDGLATAYEQMAESEKAEAALRSSLVAIPNSPHLAWRFANFLVQQGRGEEALPYLRTAAAYHWDFRAPAFDLSWKLLADPERILRDVVPSETAIQADYLLFLIRTRRLAEAYPVWSRIRKVRTPSFISVGHSYVESLATAGMGQEAARVWNEILQDTDRSGAKPPGESLTNGDIEYSLFGAGLGWRLIKSAGYQISLDELEVHHGNHSLRVIFDGSANLDFAGVQQWVPVSPNRRYRFSGYLKTENISTDSGLRFSISSVATPPQERFVHWTENRLGTMPWTQEQLDFATGPNTHVILISLRRLPSRKLNHMLQGKVWMDSVSLSVQPQ